MNKLSIERAKISRCVKNFTGPLIKNKLYLVDYKFGYVYSDDCSNFNKYIIHLNSVELKHCFISLQEERNLKLEKILN